MTRRLMDLRGPAVWLKRVKDYPKGFSVLGLPVGPTKPVVQGRLALALGYPKDTPPLNLIDKVQKKVSEKPVPPRIVTDAPFKENVLKGDSVDLWRFPAPLIHGKDGGRYIGTWHVVVIKDPETNWVNWGMYRIMVQDARRLSILLSRGPQHGGQIFYNSFEPRGKAMPIAIAIGTGPNIEHSRRDKLPSRDE